MASLERRLALLPSVRAKVDAVTDQVAAVARADLAAHRVTGEHEIVVTRPNATDRDVSLVGRGAVSVEYGRDGYTRADGTQVGAMEGLGIMRAAARSVRA